VTATANTCSQAELGSDGALTTRGKPLAVKRAHGVPVDPSVRLARLSGFFAKRSGSRDPASGVDGRVASCLSAGADDVVGTFEAERKCCRVCMQRGVSRAAIGAHTWRCAGQPHSGRLSGCEEEDV
jgi:hypothetical protein